MLIRKICEVDNKVYLIRMNKAKEIKEKVKNVIIKKETLHLKLELIQNIKPPEKRGEE